MNDLNLCQFIGRLGKDPEVRYAPSGTAIANTSLASSWKGKDGKEGTEWINIVMFGNLAEIAEKYLQKGSQLYVSGRMATRKWQDRDGNDRYSTEIVVDRFQMFGGNPANSKPQAPKQDAKPQPKQKEENEDFDDDIPF